MTFTFLNKNDCKETLSALFDILYENMNRITPTGCSYEEDREWWMSAIIPALEKEPRQIILIHDGADLAGYFQYYINEGVFMVEEIQLKPAYQRSLLLYRFCCFLKEIVPRDTKYIEAYAHKLNRNSQSVIRSLGMECIGENQNRLAWHYRGDCGWLFEKFKS